MAKLIVTPAMRARWGKVNAARKAEGKPPLNFLLWVKTRNRIDAIPESYDQTDWRRRSTTAPCGTAACLAGEAIICGPGLDKLRQMRRSDIGPLAVDLLGLDVGADEDDVFSGTAYDWPEPYSSRFAGANTQRQEARVAVAFLTHIIRTGKVLE